MAAAALLVATTGTLVVSPGARHAVAGWLGLRGERIVVVPRPVPTRLGRGLDVGRLVSLTSARAGAAFPLSVPTDPALGPPDEVYLSREVPGGQVTLLYRARPGLPPATGTGAGLLITQFRGSLQREFLEKMVGPGTTIDYLNIGGRPAYWLAGHPHELLYLDANGIQIPESVRLAGNVLIFEKGEVTVRIEGDMPERDALRIARSMG